MDQQNSILDKILESKEIEEIEQFRPQEITETLLKYLTNREKDVIRRRFGLSGNKKETLEKIGDSYKVTRERIRQIENISVKKLKKTKQFDDLVDPFVKTIVSVLTKHGGIMNQDVLLGELLKLTGDTEESRQCVLFLMERIFRKQFIHNKEDSRFYASWRLPQTNMMLVESTINAIENYFRERGKAAKAGIILKEFQQEVFFKQHAYQLSEDAILSYVDVSKKIARNPFDEYGLCEWGNVSPKRMNDKIYLVLKKNGKPMHFNKITETINQLKFDDRPAYSPTVHNELILNKEYILVGRGIYALREWGYTSGVVADVIRSILKNADHPLTRDEIVHLVLKERIVKKNTIYLALTDKHHFQKKSDGTYSIADTTKEI